MRFCNRDSATYAGKFITGTIPCVPGIDRCRRSECPTGKLQQRRRSFNCLQKDWSCEDTDTYNLSLRSSQGAGTGQIVIDWATDTPNDPIIKYSEGAINDTSAAWTGYVVNVTLDVPTPLTTYFLSDQVVTGPGPDAWTVTISQPLTSIGMNGSQYEYVGEIDMAGARV